MIQCDSLDQALAVPGVIHVDAGPPIVAYQTGDTLPAHLLPPAPPTAQELAELLRAMAKDALDNNRDEMLKILRGLAAVLVDEFNLLLGALPRAIQSITRSGTTATATTMGAHGMPVSSTRTVGIAGADVAAYNGSKNITVTGASTFTFSVAGSPATPATGSIFFALSTQAAPLGRTLEQAITAVKNQIDSGAVD